MSILTESYNIEIAATERFILEPFLQGGSPKLININIPGMVHLKTHSIFFPKTMSAVGERGIRKFPL